MSQSVIKKPTNRGESGNLEQRGPFLTVVILCTFLSGVFAILGIVFLFKFYSDLERNGQYGTLNDIMVIIQYLLMLPIALYLYQLLRSVDPRRARNSLIIGLVGMASVILLQLLLVLGVISFAIQIGFVVVGFFIVLGWFILNRQLGEDAGARSTPIPQNKALTILAGLVFGYPIWAYQLGRNLLKLG